RVDVVRFDEDDPSAAFARLGPLTRSHPDEPVVRFHLGLLLVSLGQVAEAREQLAHAARGEGLYGREARRLLTRLEEIRT
ncbi:MAG TPA: tetratricopeptide repeat protein, partial [Actinomycetota bacterium]|nr:tetratricopeptide repeat protein [Actinomycetota bacterium]